jgi:L-rhamnose mutarotase
MQNRDTKVYVWTSTRQKNTTVSYLARTKLKKKWWLAVNLLSSYEAQKQSGRRYATIAVNLLKIFTP